MIRENKIYYSLDDISLLPTPISFINHRAECEVTYKDGMYPIFTAPMSCIIDEENVEVFNSAGINVIIPRTIDLNTRLSLCKKYFIAVGLDEFEYEISKLNLSDREQIKVCVDVANGHMAKLINACRIAKDKFGDRLVLMAGNIANAKTIVDYAVAGVDYVRIGIGGGNACLTSCQTAIHAPMATLLNDIQKLKTDNPFIHYPKIIADGGIDSYDKIIKCLALGADYVMCGKIFAKCEEACGKFFIKGLTGEMYREYYGMSTKKAQKEMGKSETHTSEGIVSSVKVEYSLSSWLENFRDYLRSAMSYCGTITLNEFKNYNRIIVISNNARNSYVK